MKTCNQTIAEWVAKRPQWFYTDNRSHLLYYDMGDIAGWSDILSKLFEDFDALETSLEPKTKLIFLGQIKQKFGGLRVYTDFAIDADDETREKVWELQNAALEVSHKTCQVCSKPGESHTYRNYVRTLCPTHITEREAQ